MIISSYNRNGVGDTLMIMTGNSVFSEQNSETKGNVTRIFKEETKETVGYNFFTISELIKIEGKGSITLSADQVARLNEHLLSVGFDEQLEADEEPKFVVGDVKECKPHPNSDHLSITQIEIDDQQVVQIVCGASNIAAGQKVVVAKVGAMMPNGLVIWDGELRGEPSHGMVCSAKELGIEAETTKKGILVLDANAVTGSAFKTK